MSSSDGVLPATPTSEEGPPGQFRFGEVLNATFSVFCRRFGFLFTAALIILLPGTLVEFTYPMVNSFGKPQYGNTLIILIASALFYQLFMAIALHAVVDDLQGRTMNIGTAISRGLNTFLPCLLTGLAVMLGATLGILLLVIPGVIWLLGQSVAVPVCVIEGKGAKASLSRSWALTRGHRLKILGLLTVISLIYAVAQSVILVILLELLHVNRFAWSLFLAHHALSSLATSLVVTFSGSTYAKLVAARQS